MFKLPNTAPTRRTFPEILREGVNGARRIVIGLHDLHHPIFTIEGTNLGEWISVKTTTQEPELELRFNDDGEFAARSDKQIGPFPGEVSIPELLSQLHFHGQTVQHEDRVLTDGAYEDLMEIIFSRFDPEAFAGVSVDFTEMTYNAVTILGGPINSILKQRLADAEKALIADGHNVPKFFSDEADNKAIFALTNESVERMERLLGLCRHLVPRDPDNALCYYFQDLGRVIETKQPPAEVAAAIEASKPKR